MEINRGFFLTIAVPYENIFMLNYAPAAEVCDATNASFIFYCRLHKYFAKVLPPVPKW